MPPIGPMPKPFSPFFFPHPHLMHIMLVQSLS
jgi:hypothetical protein